MEVALFAADLDQNVDDHENEEKGHHPSEIVERSSWDRDIVVVSNEPNSLVLEVINHQVVLQEVISQNPKACSLWESHTHNLEIAFSSTLNKFIKIFTEI